MIISDTRTGKFSAALQLAAIFLCDLVRALALGNERRDVVFVSVTTLHPTHSIALAHARTHTCQLEGKRSKTADCPVDYA